ncbi:MAG: histidine--tRNA ligase [Cyclobacteriaceae bacterium]
MSSVKPSTPKGTRDFGHEQSAKRTYIIDVIKRNFLKYGFRELATPAMENLSTLTGKYGDEGDQLLFKILNSGDFLSKASEGDKKSSKDLLPKISEKGLRYDLTVPFARYVATHQHEITYPFKRFQIQPVWRADRPQKGRYREFYQCDADVVGSDSIWNEVELTQLIQDVFTDLNFDVFSIKVNHRGILKAFAKYCGVTGNEMAFCVELDKLDKIGREKVTENIVGIGAKADQVKAFMDFIHADLAPELKLARLDAEFGIVEPDLDKYFELIKATGKSLNLDFDLSLARGLTYYTGMIFEVKPTTIEMGSITGGGRYDNLTGVFGLEGVSGVGISFGLDRIYDVLEEAQLFPEKLSESVDVLIVHFDDESFMHGIEVIGQLRSAGISAGIYPDIAKMKKQMNYADKTNASHVLVIGSEEIKSKKYSFKSMASGDQNMLSLEEIIKSFDEK